jgi:hypothetical protein
VERAIKLAVPAACFVIVLFGAPLAMSAPRAGAAIGIAASLGTTVAYLMLINLTRAIGSSGLMNPTLAAWAQMSSSSVGSCAAGEGEATLQSQRAVERSKGESVVPTARFFRLE